MDPFRMKTARSGDFESVDSPLLSTQNAQLVSQKTDIRPRLRLIRPEVMEAARLCQWRYESEDRLASHDNTRLLEDPRRNTEE